MASVPLKQNYHCVQSLQQFYSGGPYAVSSEGSFIACACNDMITIVDSSNASIKSTIEGDSETVTALALSPDDKFLFSASHSHQIIVWELLSLKKLRSWKGHQGPVMSMACHAFGGFLATAGADGEVLVWDVDGGFCTHHFKGHTGVVNSVIFHPDPACLHLFSCCDDTTVRVWDLTSMKCLATLERHCSTVTSIAITEDGWTLLSGGRDQVVNLWNLHDYSCITSVRTNESIEALCLIGKTSPFVLCTWGKKSSDMPAFQFFTVGEHGIVRIWNSHGAICLFQQAFSDVTVSKDDEEEARRGFMSAVMLPSGQELLCVTADQEFLFYSPLESPEGTFQLNLNKRLVGYNEDIVDMKFLGVEEQFLAVAASVEQLRVYDLSSMTCSYVLAGHTDIVLCLDTCTTSSGRTLIVTGSKDYTVRLWDPSSHSCIGVGRGHMGGVGAVAFAKKSHNFFISGSSDLTLKVWRLDDLLDDVNDVFSLRIKAVTAAHDKDINALAIAPNDSLVCSGSQDRTARIWKLPDLTPGVVLRGHKRGIWSVEFSPVDQCVITGSGDKTIKIWAISDGSCLKTFEGHTSSVFKVQFLTCGAQFVSCGADGLVKLWTVKTNECVATCDQHKDKVWALTIGKKTEMLATGGSDAVINLWHDSTAADKEDTFRKEEEGVLKGQELQNAVLDANYTKAIHLAFELCRPHKLFELFGELCKREDAKDQVKKALGVFSTEEYRQLLEYIREWITKPNLYQVAQIVLFQVFSILPPTEILENQLLLLMYEQYCHVDSHALRVPEKQKPKPRPFKFHNYLASKQEFLPIVRDVWRQEVPGFPMYSLVSKMKLLKPPLRKLHFSQGNLFDKVKKSREELAKIQSAVAADPSNVELRLEEAVFVKSYNEAAVDEESFLKQKSKNGRVNKDMIETVLDLNGDRYSGQQVGEQFVKHFQNVLGCSNVVQPINEPDQLFLKNLSVEDAELMVRPVTDEEIEAALFDIDDDKAPGPDGFSSKFFKAAWYEIGNDVCNAIKDFFYNGKLLKEVNATLIALVPKLDTPQKVSDFKPIACCNVIYKCISKVISNRIKGVLGEIVDENQSDFIPTRPTSDDIVSTQELKKRGPSKCAFKIDVQKAYDSVEWGFLKECLIYFGFHACMIEWIINCVSSPSFTIAVNGEYKGYFKGKRGLRRGDPISPYLFTLVMEVLNLMIKRQIRDGEHFEYHWKREEMQLTRLCFADDLLVFCHGDRESVLVLRRALDEFSKSSGYQG